VTVSTGNAQIGANFNITATFQNDGTDTGYGPFIDLYIPHTGTDGVYPGTTPGVDEYDGISANPGPNYTATYLSNNLTVTTLTFPDDGGGTGCVDHPLALDNAGFFQQVCGTAGDQLVVITLPFGSFAPDQPTATVTIPAQLSDLADAGTALNIRARGGFQFGRTPLVDWCCTTPTDTTILSDTGAPPTWTANNDVIPDVINVSKTTSDAETPTGPNYPRTYTLSVNIANGQALTGIDISDSLPDNIVYLGNLTSTPAYTTLVSVPVGGAPQVAPDNLLSLHYDGPVNGATDITVTFDYYIAQDNAGGSPVIPGSGTPGSTSNSFTVDAATWTPVDVRDAPVDLSGVGIGTATSSDNAITLDKASSIAVDNGTAGPTQGDIIAYTLTFQVSDYFGLANLSLLDTLPDGLHFYTDGTHQPSLTINQNGGTSTVAFAAANYEVNCNYTGAGGECAVPDPGGAVNGQTVITFDVSGQIGGSGQLLGGLVDDGLPADDGPTSGTVTFYAKIQDAYTDNYSGGSVKMGDSFANTATASGDLVDPATCSSGTCSTITANVATNGANTTVNIGRGTLEKTIVARNGNVCNPATFAACSNVQVAAGDTITYRISYSLLSGDFADLQLTDFLPLPIFHADDPDADGILIPTDPDWAQYGGANPVPDAGTWMLGPGDTRAILPTASMSPHTVNNYLRFEFGDYDDPTNTPSLIDVLFTITVTTQPYADGLHMTNQVQQQDSNSPGTVTSASELVQLTLTQPVLVANKTVVSTDHAGIMPTPPVSGPVIFTTPGDTANPPWNVPIPINTTYLGANPLDGGIDGIDGGDLVKFAIVIENVGTGINGAFDITVRDTLPSGYIVPGIGAQGINLQVTRGDGTAFGFTNVGGGTGLLDQGIQINDPVVPPADPEYGHGACQGHDPVNGKNVILVTYDLMVDPTVAPGQLIQNNGELTGYAGSEGGDNYLPQPEEDTSDSTIGGPTLTKTLVSTEIVNASNGNTQAVIGELVTYQVQVTFPEGTSPNTQIVDTLDPGLAFVAQTNFTNSDPGNVTISGASAPVITNSGATVTWNLGTVTNAANSNSTPETLTFEYTAVVLDVAGNQNSGPTMLNNSATLTWDTYDETGATVPASAGPSSADEVEVIEPELNVAKSFSTASADAGDAAAFTLSLTHTASSQTDAQDVTVSDPLPQCNAVTTSAITISNPATAISVVDSAGLLTPADFTLSGSNAAGWTLQNATGTTFDFAYDPARTIDVTVSGVVAYCVNPAQTLTNTGTIRWTSLDGTFADRSTYTTTSDERTGAGGVDDYTDTASDTLTITVTTPNKYLLTTSEAHTSGQVSGNEVVTIGEIVRYRLVVTIPEGTSPNFQMQDRLPNGLIFLDDSTAKAAFVSDSGITSNSYGILPVPGITDASCNLVGNSADGTNPAIPAGCSALANANIGSSNSTAADLNVFGSGADVYFKLGELVNNDSDADGEYVIVEFNAIVHNTAYSPDPSNDQNDAGDVRSNDFIVTVNGSQIGSASNTIGLLVTEPSITFNKQIISTPVPLDAGGVVHYRISFSNGVGNNVSAAQDVRLTDALAAALQLPTINAPDLVITTGGTVGTITNNSTVNGIDVTVDSVAPGGSITIDYYPVIQDSITPAQVVNNTGNATWTSLPGSGTNPNGTGSVNGAAGGNFGERNGSGGVNDYTATRSRSFTSDGVTIVKQLTDTSAIYTSGSNVAIGEEITYDILLTFPEGTTAADTVVDTLPAGLTLVAGTPEIITTTAAPGSLLAADFSGTMDAPTITETHGATERATFGFANVAVSGDNDATNNTIQLRFHAQVADVIGNQAGTVLSNSASNQVGAAAATNSTPVTATVVEPVITFSKTIVSTPTPLDAGGVVHYQISFANAAGASTAMDVHITDALAAALLLPSTGAPDLVITPSAGVTGVTNNSTTSSIDITIASVPAGESVVVDFSPVIQNSITPGQVVGNSGTSTWTSLSGSVSGERTGAGGVDDYTATTPTVNFTSDGTVGITKQLTDTSAIYTSGSNVAIGEVVTYALLVTFPEGTTPADTVLDDLPAGLAVVAGSPQVITTAAASGGLLTADFNGSIGAQNITTDTSDGGSVQFDYTNVVVDDDNDATNNTILLSFQARVIDVLANQAGTTISNVATNQVGVNPATSSNTVDVTVVEPAITFGKTIVSTPTPLDAGGVVHYQISFANAAGASTAMDVHITDALAAALLLPSTGAPDLVITPSAGVTGVTNNSTTSSIDITVASVPAGESVVVDFSPVIQNSITPGQVVGNSGNSTWTSLSGSVSGERTGAGGVDDYTATSSVNFTTTSPTATKSLTATSETATSGNNVAIGEDITYDVVLGFTEGTTATDSVVDTLPAGLVLVAGSPQVITTAAASGGLLTADFNGTMDAPTITELHGATERVTYGFSNVVVTGDNNTNNNAILLRFHAQVRDIIGNQQNTTLSNSATNQVNGGTPVATNAVTATVVEPVITFTKTLVATPTPLDAGGVVHYRLTYANGSGATVSTAMDVAITDNFAAAPLRLPTTGAPDLVITTAGTVGTITNNSTTSGINITVVSVAPGGSVTIDYYPVIQNGITPAQVVTNTGNSTWTSLAGSVTGERTGAGGVDDYTLTRTRNFTSSMPVAITKALQATSETATSGANVAIGEDITYDVVVTFSEGTTATDTAVDTLPAGLVLVAGSPQVITTAAASSGRLSADFNGTMNVPTITETHGATERVTYAFTNVVVAGDNVTTNNAILLRFHAQVADVIGNQAGTVLSNSASNQIGVNPATGSNTVSVTVVEPVITFGKTIVSTPTPLDAGGVVHYQISFANAAGASTAQDIHITDALAAALRLPTTGAPDLVITPTAGVGTVTNNSTTSNIDITVASVPAGESVVVDFYPVIQASVTPGQVVGNSGNSTWTSLSGSATGERTGAGGVDDYTATTPTVNFTDTGAVGITKQILTTSETDTSGSNVAIGEVVTYALLVTFPEGTTPADTVLDDIPTGLAIIGGSPQLITTAAASGGLLTADFNGSIGAQGITTDTSDGGSVQFDYINVVVAGDNVTTNNAILLTFQARVTDILANQAGTTISNVATNQVGVNPATSSNTVDVTVVEPVITFGKTIVSTPTPLDAGGVVHYQISFANAAGASTAQDVHITDALAAALRLPTTGAPDLVITPTAGVGTVTNNSTTSNIDITIASVPAGESIVVDFYPVIQASVTPGQVVGNSGNSTWTSLAGSATGERTGSGGVDDYTATTPTVNFTDTGAVGITKQILTTSETDTSGSNVAIGEVVTYGILVTFPEGTTPADTVLDDIPTGLAIIGGSPQLITTAAASGGLLTADFNGSIGAQGITTDTSDGGSVQFDYINVVVAGDNDTTNNAILLTFQARVTDILANQAGTTISNVATNQVGVNPATGSNTVSVTVVEPVITFGKTIVSTPTPLDAGGVVHYQISFANAAGASTAQDVHITDALAAALRLPTTGAPDLVITPTAGVGTVTNNSTTSNIDITVASVPAGESVVVDFYPVIQASVTPGQVVGNIGNSTWTSLAGSATGERTGSGGVDDYTATTANQTFQIHDPAFSKSIDHTSATHSIDPTVAIGETVTFDLQVTLPEGTTPGITIDDDLPSGLRYVLGSATLNTTGFNGTVASMSATPTVPPIGSGDDMAITIGQVDVAADNIDTNNTFHILFEAVVLNEAGNQSGNTLTNSATMDIAGTDYGPDTADVNIVEAVLTVDKSVDIANPILGQVLTYTILVAHNVTSNLDALAVEITDTLPVGLEAPTGITVTQNPLLCATGVDTSGSSGNNLLVQIDRLPLGCQLTITYQSEISPPPNTPAIGTVLNNTSNLSWTSLGGLGGEERTGGGGIDDYDASDGATVTFANIDLTLSKDDGGVTVVPGDTIIYQLDYANDGTLDSTGVTITETVPAHTTFDLAGSSAGWSCLDDDPAGTTCTLIIPTVLAGANGSVNFAVTVDNPVPVGIVQIDNQATITDDGTHGDEPTPADNQASDDTPLDAAPDIRIEKTDGLDTVSPATVLIYTLTVENMGNQDAIGVAVTDTLPVNVTYVAGSANDGGVYNSGTGEITWPVFDLAAGDSVTRTFSVTVNDPFPAGVSTITNSAHAEDDGSNGTDLDTLNNDDSDTDNVITIPNTDTSKILAATNQAHTPDAPDPLVAIGEILTYQVVLNVPSGALPSLVLTDTLDTGLAFVDCVSITPSAVDLTTDIGGAPSNDFTPVCANPVVSAMPLLGMPGYNAASSPGRRMVLNFGNVNNAGAATATLTVSYRVVVLDIAANIRNSDFSNNAAWTWTGGDLNTRATPNVAVVEPDLGLEKTADRTSATPGAIITFQLHVFHTTESQTDAFDAVLTDTLPAELIYVPGSLRLSSGLAPTSLDDTNPSSLVITWDTFGYGLESVIEFQARLGPLHPGMGTTNTANVAWTSLPGIPAAWPGQPVGVQSQNNIYSTERRYDPVSPVDVYGASASLRIGVPKLPETGFAPNTVTIIPPQPADAAYQAMGDMWLEIPRLKLNVKLTGVPMGQNGWDLTWLWDKAGWLDGSAYPGLPGNAAITGHVYLPDGKPGPFADLHTLFWGDQIILHANGQRYVYEVRETRRTWPDDLSILQHEKYPWLTLITCQGYVESKDEYTYRIAVRAVLIKVEADTSRPASR
jgi:LPXTG-site transpeptidase (sortase) family protein